MKSVAGRRRRACNKPVRDKHVRRLTESGRPYVIRYSMTSRGPRREVVELRANRPLATWSRNEITGALECRWSMHRSAASVSDEHVRPPESRHLVNIVNLHRQGMHADLRPPSR
ncbi:hypothetical protein [Dyella tabacisoli]